jgi:hypothetical protein
MEKSSDAIRYFQSFWCFTLMRRAHTGPMPHPVAQRVNLGTVRQTQAPFCISYPIRVSADAPKFQKRQRRRPSPLAPKWP